MAGKQTFAPPPEMRERTPMLTEAGYRMWKGLLEHPHAPVWNYEVGDRLVEGDLARVAEWRARVDAPQEAPGTVPGPELLDRVAALTETVALFRERLPRGFDLARDWAHVPTMDREDIATRIADVVPADAPLDRLIVYDTSGTTGHALVVPNHPLAVAKCHPLLEHALARHGVRPVFSPGRVACLNVGAQVHTAVFATVFTVWREAGFAKVNLHPSGWRAAGDAARFFQDTAPEFLTGDPVAFAEMLRREIPVRPQALVSTAVNLSPALARELAARFGCPVVDFYSSTETGPVAVSCPDGHGWHVAAPDIFVEVVDGAGFPLPEGEAGGIAVTGGRNPYLPLLRYRTGDRAALRHGPCTCGDPGPTLTDFSGRAPIVFRGEGGAPVNSVDVGRVVRDHLVLGHELVQAADGAVRLTVCPVPGVGVDRAALERGLLNLFGPGVPLDVSEDAELLERMKAAKVPAYRCEMDE